RAPILEPDAPGDHRDGALFLCPAPGVCGEELLVVVRHVPLCALPGRDAAVGGAADPGGGAHHDEQHLLCAGHHGGAAPGEGSRVQSVYEEGALSVHPGGAVIPLCLEELHGREYALQCLEIGYVGGPDVISTLRGRCHHDRVHDTDFRGEPDEYLA